MALTEKPSKQNPQQRKEQAKVNSDEPRILAAHQTNLLRVQGVMS